MSRGKPTKGMRSKLEVKVAEQMDRYGVQYLYEDKEYTIGYEIPAKLHRYLPDFVINTKAGKLIYIEAKGIWDYSDRFKHLLIKRQRPELDIRFVFQRAKQRIRKGSKTTYRDICEGRGTSLFKDVTWKYSDGGIVPEEWMNE